jgi:nucleotide-binding universal stress UspA family protein
MNVRVIVVGVDDSPEAKAAIEFTAGLAADLGARVVAVHAFEPLRHIAEVEPGRPFHDIRENLRAHAEEHWCGPLAGVDHEVVVDEGRPCDVIVDQAAKAGADLIVLGARKMGRLKELAVGSTSHRVIQTAGCPVTVMHDG